MGKHQVALLTALRKKELVKGIKLYQLVEDANVAAPTTTTYTTLRILVRNGYMKVNKCHAQASPFSKFNTFSITKKGDKALTVHQERKRLVLVDPNVIPLNRKKVKCDSGACQHAKGVYCGCSCHGAHHGELVAKRKPLTAKQRKARILELTQELQELLAA